MFRNNDKTLFITRLIVIVTLGIFAVLSLGVGIFLAVTIKGVYFLFTFVGWFLCWLFWVGARLVFSYLVDIKLIRNKLYDESNDGLEMFLDNAFSKRERNEPSVDAQLKQLQKLLKSGTITREQYDSRVEELTKRK